MTRSSMIERERTAASGRPGMEWRCSRRLAVAALLVLLALRSASAVAPGDGGGALDVARYAGRKSLAGSPIARQAYPRINHSHKNAVARARVHDDTRKFTSRNPRKLRIAVPLKHGFEAFVKITHPNTDEQKVTGYSIDVFKTAFGKFDNLPQYDFYPFDGTYDELVRNVSTGVYDAAVGDVTITAERIVEVDFTMPYIESGLAMLVLSDNNSKAVQWIFLEPLTKELWIAIFVGIFFTGFVVWMIEHPRNPEYQGSSMRQFSNSLYFAFSTWTFSHEHIIRSPLSKIVIVVWCFAVLLLVQSYTANLSSMLTTKRLQPLVLDGDYIGYQGGTFVGSFLKNEGFSENKIIALKDQAEYAEALRKGSKNGGVSAIVDEIPYLTYFLHDPQYKKEFTMVNRKYNYRTPGFGFVFPLGSRLVHYLSIAILEMTQGNEVSTIEEKWLGRGVLTTDDDSPIADSKPLTLQSFSGLFVITGCVSTLMLLIRIAWLAYARYTRIRGSRLQVSDEEAGLQVCAEEDGSANQGKSRALQDDMGYQNHSEERSEHSTRSHGSNMSVGNTEPCQMIQDDSVPVDFVQIEMSSNIGQSVGQAS